MSSFEDALAIPRNSLHVPNLFLRLFAVTFPQASLRHPPSLLTVAPNNHTVCFHGTPILLFLDVSVISTGQENSAYAVVNVNDQDVLYEDVHDAPDEVMGRSEQSNRCGRPPWHY